MKAATVRANAAENGDGAARDALIASLNDEVHRLARRELGRGRPAGGLDPRDAASRGVSRRRQVP